MLAVAHRPTQTSVRLWLQAEQKDRGWGVRVVHAGDGRIHRSWALDEHSGHIPLTNLFWLQPDTRMWHETVDDLQAGTWYEVWFEPPAGAPSPAEPAATFRTLPGSLDGGFTVLLGSCYSEDRDVRRLEPVTRALERAPGVVGTILWWAGQRLRHAYVELTSVLRTGPAPVPQGWVSAAYRGLCESGTRPDLKILTGDQVYVDQPVHDFLVPWRSDGWIARHLSRTYFRSWSKLSWFLSHGANVCITDDHEFRNDYPDVPSFPTPWLTMLSESFRRRWDERALGFVRDIQLPVTAERLDLGTDLSLFVADTRINRDPVPPGDAPAPPAAGFMDEDDFTSLIDWIGGLAGPGVLVVGQPLLTRREGVALGVRTDVNLPYFDDQYARLCRALTAAPHDVVVLTGDVHFWRVATVTLPRHDRERPTTVVEVISSPMSQVFGAPGKFDPAEVPPELLEFPHAWRPGHDYYDPEIVAGPAPVTYLPVTPETDRNRNNVMTIRFTRPDRTKPDVHMEITTHLVRHLDRNGVPAARPTGEIVLR